MDVMLRATNAVMSVAPVGIFAAIAGVVTVQGLGVILTYGKLIGWFSNSAAGRIRTARCAIARRLTLLKA